MEDVEVEVVSLSGSTVATVSLPPTASVADLKERIAEASGTQVALQRLVVPSRPLADEEPLSLLTLSGETEISVILILQELPPVDFEVDGHPQQITSVQVKRGEELVKVPLAESPNMVLKRLLQNHLGNPLSDGHLLFWEGIPITGSDPIRDRLLEVIQSECRTPKVDGSMVTLDLKPNPAPLPQSSILCGLSSGKFFGTHPLGLPPCGTWGWIRLADSDQVCGLRVMSHPTCGNTTPSGSFMIEYLGTVTSCIQIEEGTAVYNATRLLALRNLPEAQESPAVTCEAIHLGQGVMAVHQHAPLEAVIVSSPPDLALISVKVGSTEMITVPMHMAQGQPQLPPLPDAFGELLPPGQFFQPVSTCAHLNHVPKRYNPSWLERKLRQFMFG